MPSSCWPTRFVTDCVVFLLYHFLCVFTIVFCSFIFSQYVLADFKVPSLAVTESNQFKVQFQPSLTSAATDGSSLYAFDGLGTGCISKIGTGLHGTLAGDVTSRVTNLRGQLSALYEAQQPILTSTECEAKFSTAKEL